MSLSKVNFYQWDSCQQILSEPRFWLVERGNNKPISIYTEEEANKATLVINDNRKTLLVLPIDKNVPIKKIDNPNDEESLCDVLIQTQTDNELIIFAELKNARSSFISKAADQLEITINAYRKSHINLLESFQKRFAYITHRSDYRVYVSHKDLSRKFRTEYRCKLCIEKDIAIL